MYSFNNSTGIIDVGCVCHWKKPRDVCRVRLGSVQLQHQILLFHSCVRSDWPHLSCLFLATVIRLWRLSKAWKILYARACGTLLGTCAWLPMQKIYKAPFKKGEEAYRSMLKHRRRIFTTYLHDVRLFMWPWFEADNSAEHHSVPVVAFDRISYSISHLPEGSSHQNWFPGSCKT